MLEFFVKGKMLADELQKVLDSNDSRLNIKLSSILTVFHKNVFEKADTELKLNAIEILEETIQDIKKSINKDEVCKDCGKVHPSGPEIMEMLKAAFEKAMS